MDEELEEVEDVDLNNDEEIEPQNVDVDEEVNEDEVYELDEEEQKGEQEEETTSYEEPKKNPLQKALNAERNKNKELKKQLKALKEKNSKSTYDTLVEKGVEEELAKTLAEAIDKPKGEVKDLQFKADLLRVSKKGEFADIEDYEDEVKSFVDKGLTIEQAYYAATGGRKKQVENTKSEIKREYEARMKAKKQRADMLDIDTTGNALDKNKKAIKYTAQEAAVAKAAGMTIEEYKKIQNMSSVDDYINYKQSKIK